MSLSNVLRTRSINAAALVVCCVFAFAVFGNEVGAVEIVAGQPLPTLIGSFETPSGVRINQYVPTDRANGVFGTFGSTSISPGNERISFGSGTRLPFAGDPTIKTAGGSLYGSRSGALALSPNVKIPITATAKIPGAGAASLIKKALPLVGLAAAGPLGVALTSLAFELGYNLAFGSGEPVVTKSDPSVCSVAPCYEYHASRPTDVNYMSTYYSSAQAAAQASIDYDNSHTNWWIYTLVSVGSGLSGTYSYTTKNKTTGAVSGPSTGYFESRSKAPSAPSYVPATQQELADAIANKTGWPDSSAIAEALNQSQRATGEVIPTEGPKVTGPATVQGPTEVTKKPIPNGTRETTTQTDYNCVYVDGATVMDGGTVACTQKTTTTDKDTVTDPQTQQTTTTTTQTSETTKPADTTAEKPLETKDPCDTNPDRVGCATLDTPEGEIPKVTKTFNYQYEELGLGNGSCPAPASTRTMLGTFSVDLTAYCDAISTFVRPLVILFGMLAAFIIASPVKVDL